MHGDLQVKPCYLLVQLSNHCDYEYESAISRVSLKCPLSYHLSESLACAYVSIMCHSGQQTLACCANQTLSPQSQPSLTLQPIVNLALQPSLDLGQPKDLRLNHECGGGLGHKRPRGVKHEALVYEPYPPLPPRTQTHITRLLCVC